MLTPRRSAIGVGGPAVDCDVERKDRGFGEMKGGAVSPAFGSPSSFLLHEVPGWIGDVKTKYSCNRFVTCWLGGAWLDRVTRLGGDSLHPREPT